MRWDSLRRQAWLLYTKTENATIRRGHAPRKQTITLGPAISENIRAHLKQLLIKKSDIFASQHADMTGVPRHLAEHHLNTYKFVAPIAQKHGRGESQDNE